MIEALRNAACGRTVIMATHSAALARSADVVHVIADATIHLAREVIGA